MGTVEVRELSVRAGQVVLRRADLVLPSGAVVAVVGDAGARALVRTVAGVLSPMSGALRVAGEDVTGRPAADVAARGVVLVPAGWTAFGTLTVGENVLVGARGDGSVAGEVLARLPLSPAAAAASLDPADTRVLAVAVALARQPRVLLVDGLAAVGAAAARSVLSAVRASGATTVVAERASFAGRAVVPPDGFDPAAYDRVLVARGGALRPWRPES